MKTFDWHWYRDNLAQCSRNAETDCGYVLNLIAECDALVRQLTDRDMAIDSDRPQDYVVPVLAARAYRLAISGIWVALAGFPDSVPNLTRTIFEIGVRLLDMSHDPVSGSLGYLMQGAHEEISTIRAELAFRRESSLSVGNLEINLQTMESYLVVLRGIASKMGYSPEKTQKRYGRLNIRDICRRFGIERAYLVDFAFYTGHVHEKHIAYSAFTSEDKGRRLFNLGIADKGIPHAVGDLLTNLSRVLDLSCSLLGDHMLIERGRALAGSVSLAVERIRHEDQMSDA